MIPKVSVIIPAFNAEAFLGRALDCLVNQTFGDFEVIIVNDGSTDGTGTLAEKYMFNDGRFKVLYQVNSGVAAARQKGLDMAIGKYVYYFDADDWADPGALEGMISAAEAEDADMLFCDFYITQHNGETVYQSQKPKSLDSISLFGQYLSEMYGTLWNRLIKREVFLQYGIHFIAGMDACEDAYIIWQLLSHGIKVAYLEKAFYHYDLSQNSQSIMNKGTTVEQRLRPLIMIAEYTDVSPVMQYYCNAFFRVAWLSRDNPTSLCPNYARAFKPYLRFIMRASAPFHSKLPILLRICKDQFHKP